MGGVLRVVSHFGVFRSRAVCVVGKPRSTEKKREKG